MIKRQRLAAFLRSETAGGGILIVAALLGLLFANGPLSAQFHALATTSIGPAELHLQLTIEEWTAGALLALFFFVIGCELRHELEIGTLSRPRAALLPVAAAIGGMLLPAGIYLAVNGATPQGELGGWGIPMATDIAFALAVLAVLGRGLPTGVRAFLLTLAVVDDLGAILIIALFYSGSLHLEWLAISGALVAAFALAQHRRIEGAALYLVLAIGTWIAVHESGLHPTIAGVAIGLAMRVRSDLGEEASPADRALARIHPISAGIAVPLFALFAAAVDLRTVDVPAALASPIFLGVLLGLVLGKPIGILLAARLAARVGAELPTAVTWNDIAVMGALGGIGFTVSLLIGQLAFDAASALGSAKLGVLLASLLAVALAALLRALRMRRTRGGTIRSS